MKLHALQFERMAALFEQRAAAGKAVAIQAKFGVLIEHLRDFRQAPAHRLCRDE